MSTHEGGATAGEGPQAKANVSQTSVQTTVQALLDYLNDYRIVYRDVRVGPIAIHDEYRTMLAAGDGQTPLEDCCQVLPILESFAGLVDLHQFLPLTNLYAEERWLEALPAGMPHLIGQETNYYQVPVEVHRGNVLWYNPQVLKTAGIATSELSSIDLFVKAAEKLRSTGVIPLCVADTSGEGVAQLFENLAVGVLGVGKFSALWNGALAAEDVELSKTVEIVRQLLADRPVKTGISEEQARSLLGSGKCAFLSASASAYRQLVDAGLKECADFDRMAFPGTEQVFVAMANAYSCASGKEDQASTYRLRTLGSRAAQQAITANRVSICARSDCDRSNYNAFQNWETDAYLSKLLVPSYVYGVAALSVQAEAQAKLGGDPCGRWAIAQSGGSTQNLIFCCPFGLPCCYI